MPGQIPQVAAIVKVMGSHEISLCRDVRGCLGPDDQALYLNLGKEVVLTTKRAKRSRRVALKKNRLPLAEDIMAALGLEKGSLVAMIQRRNGLALKKMVIEAWLEGDRAEVMDHETAHLVTRVAHMNPMPEDGLRKLKKLHATLQLRHRVQSFLRGRKTLGAWEARKLIGCGEARDEQLRKSMVEERLEAQSEDGSWEGSVVLTARNLRELHDLGVGRNTTAMRKGAKWLLARPESPHNPGLFFLTDDLVEELARCIEGRKEFRKRKPPEMAHAAAGDDLYRQACGPRVLWPNAIVLECLIDLGYERHKRVQAALRSLMRPGGWCECTGLVGKGPYEPPGMTELDSKLEEAIRQFRQGHPKSIEMLAKFALTRKSGTRMSRVSHSREGDRDVFTLGAYHTTAPCTLVTTRALSNVKDQRMRRLLECKLWDSAARQASGDGQIGVGRNDVYFHSTQQPVFLDTFARCDQPIAKLAIMRLLPWIIDNQNQDGSWGQEEDKDATTHAVLAALVSVKDYLPSDVLAARAGGATRRR